MGPFRFLDLPYELQCLIVGDIIADDISSNSRRRNMTPPRNFFALSETGECCRIVAMQELLQHLRKYLDIVEAVDRYILPTDLRTFVKMDFGGC